MKTALFDVRNIVEEQKSKKEILFGGYCKKERSSKLAIRESSSVGVGPNYVVGAGSSE